MGRTCFCWVRKRSVARTTVSAFVMKPKFRHKSQMTGFIPAANDTTQRINVIIRHRPGNGGNKIPNSSGRKREYRCLPFPSLAQLSPKPTCTLAPISQSFSGKKHAFRCCCQTSEMYIAVLAMFRRKGKGKQCAIFNSFSLERGPLIFWKGPWRRGEKKREALSYFNPFSQINHTWGIHDGVPPSGFEPQNIS